jgi:hypothetical protein
MKRFLNVLMSTEFRPRLLQQLGRRLNKDDLEEGVKMNQEVFEFFLCEYNKTDKYGDNHFVVDGFDQDAAAFTPIRESSWKKALDKFKEISLIYNGAFNASKQSGTMTILVTGSGGDRALAQLPPPVDRGTWRK